MTFLSLYESRIKPVADWCDSFYLNSLQHANPGQGISLENSSLVGQLEAEALGRMVCLGTIASGIVLVPVDIVLTAVIGIAAFACACAQTRVCYPTFVDWRKATETEIMFLTMIMVSVTSLTRSIFNEKVMYSTKEKTTPSLDYLSRDAEDIRLAERDEPIYSRTSAIAQLFCFDPWLFLSFVLGCVSVPCHLVTFGYFRKWDDSFLTKVPSYSLYPIVARTFHTLSCFIHIARPETIEYDNHCFLQNMQTGKNFVLGDNATLFEGREAGDLCLVRFSMTYNCWTSQNYIQTKAYDTVVLVVRDLDEDFAVTEKNIVFAKKVKDESDGKWHWFLPGNKEIDLHMNGSFLVSGDKSYAVLGRDSEKRFFTLNGGLSLNTEKSTMIEIPLIRPET